MCSLRGGRSLGGGQRAGYQRGCDKGHGNFSHQISPESVWRFEMSHFTPVVSVGERNDELAKNTL
jgi:hypothetical protein